MRRLFPLIGFLCAPALALAATETACEIEAACAQLEACRKSKSGSPTPLVMQINTEGALVLDHGHRVAEFDHVKVMADGRVYAQSLPDDGVRQEMLSISPDGAFVLTIHDPAGPGISITAFGTCQETLNWTS